MVGAPSSLISSLSAPARRASWNPKVCVRKISVASPNSTPSTNAVPDFPILVPGAIPVTSAADKSCTPKPVAFDPDGPTQIAIGTLAFSIRRYKSRILSRPTKEALELICRTKAWAPLLSASVIARSIASTTMLSMSPETWKTSTGARLCAVGFVLIKTAGSWGGSLPDEACATSTKPSTKPTAMKTMASLRTSASDE